VEGAMNNFNKIYKFLWLLLILLVMFLSSQRNVELADGKREVVSVFSSSPYLSIITIIFIVLMTSISVLRALESRNQWRKFAEEENANKVLEKIEKEKK